MSLTVETMARLRAAIRDAERPGRRVDARVDSLDLLALLVAYADLRTVLLNVLEADESAARASAYSALRDNAP